MKILEYDAKEKKMEYRDMTPEEIAEHEKMAEMEKDFVPPPTGTERLEALEMAMLEIAEVMANG